MLVTNIYRDQQLNPLDPNLLGITASPTEIPGAVDPIGDIFIDHILPFKDTNTVILTEFTK